MVRSLVTPQGARVRTQRRHRRRRDHLPARAAWWVAQLGLSLLCWIRDATFTLMALLDAGYEREAAAWREWLVRAVAGDPARMPIMYGVPGERRLPEFELPWLPGYAGSTPVRVGNAASRQFQLDPLAHRGRRPRWASATRSNRDSVITPTGCPPTSIAASRQRNRAITAANSGAWAGTRTATRFPLSVLAIRSAIDR
ncbi:glycoside hydrolase family 15 protein [Actinophytocola sp.]|uniref:glycoside hydrolase family 15 protein n=1 Tax=Actinophytocola sp. TaxID=1872138 RepID=UPI0039C855A9